MSFPRGAHGVILVGDDAHRYGGGPNAGEHGGASLAEVVAPCVLVGNADIPAATDDEGQKVRPVRAPAWWHLDVGVEAVELAPEKKPARKAKPVEEKQLPLLPPPRAPPARVAPESPLARSELLKARARDTDGGPSEVAP